MRFFTILCFVLLATVANAQNGKKLKVLFIGNSYTAVNTLPQIVADIAAANGDTLDWDMEAPGGYYLLSHVSVNPPKTINKIKQGDWQYVALQEQSLGAAIPDANIGTTFFRYARRLDSFINLYNSCAETVMYMTWGRKNGDSFYCDYYTKKFNWPYYCTYNSMDSMIRLRYQLSADSNNAIVSPVGAVWRYIRNHYPAIELYSADESHPSQAGSYAAACAFYTALYKKDPESATYNYTLSNADAANIRTAAKKVVYDSMLYWNIGKFRTEAFFSHSTVSGDVVTFNNTTLNATSYTWYFGDGQTSTANSPTHTYTALGKYTVMLVAKNDTTGCIDTAYALVSVFPTGAGQIANSRDLIKIQPNPNNGQFTITIPYDKVQVSVVNIYGQVVYQSVVNEGVLNIDMSNQPKGVYIVSVNHVKIMGNYRVVVE